MDLLKTKKNDKGQLVLSKSDLERIVQIILASKITGYKLKELIDQQLSLSFIKDNLTQIIADLENIFYSIWIKPTPKKTLWKI